MAGSKKRRVRTMEELRSKLEMLRSQKLALEAETATCSIARQRLLEESNLAFLRSRQIAGLPETLQKRAPSISRVIISMPTGWTLEETSEGNYNIRSTRDGGPGERGPVCELDVQHVAVADERKRAVRRQEKGD